MEDMGTIFRAPPESTRRALHAPVVTVQLNGLGAETELVLTVQFSEHLDIEEVQKLMHGGSQEGWGATTDCVKDSPADPHGRRALAGPQIYVFFRGRRGRTELLRGCFRR